MDLTLTPEQEAFRKEVRDWLEDNMRELPRWWSRMDVPAPESDSSEYRQFHVWWHRKLNKAGYVGIAWPKEYGGGGRTLMDQVILNDELARHRAPGPTNVHALGWVGPAMMAAGPEEMKKYFVPRMLNCDDIWCTLYSEPEAGSDMAAAQTRAVEDGDDFVVNGQKVWTSGGHYADWAVLLARTNPNVPKHRGLSYMIVNMHSPGITLRPLVQITGHAEFNETFLDNVRIPKKQILGEKDKGWYVAVAALEFERSGGGASIARENQLRDLLAVLKKQTRNGQPLSRDPVMRQKLAQFFIEASVLKCLDLRGLTHQLRTGRPGSRGAIGSLFGVEFGQHVQEFAMQVLGPYNQLMRGSKYVFERGQWPNGFLSSRGSSIATGTTEVKRNVIAMRVLGLPRSY